MPPFSFMILVMFHVRYVGGGGRFFWNLGLLRASLKYRDGTIFSRPVKDGKRLQLETWENGVRIWVNPDYDAIMAESQRIIDACAREFRVTRVYGPGDFIP